MVDNANIYYMSKCRSSLQKL